MASCGEKTKTVFRILWNFRSTLLLVLLPIVLLPIPLALPSEDLSQDVASCMYCIIIIAAYWIAELLPLAVTAFLPLIMFPLMGIMTATAVSVVYLKDTNWLVFGGLMIAVAVEHTGLHKRIALGTLLAVGSKPHSLMLGFMIPTYLLSMWISNTATTAMMIPIVNSVLKELVADHTETDEADSSQNHVETNGDLIHDFKSDTISNGKLTSFTKSTDKDKHDSEMAFENAVFDEGESSVGNSDESIVESAAIDDIEELPETRRKRQYNTRLRTGLTLCVPYAATLGGISTITGTGPNAIMVGQYDILFPCAVPKLTFGNWMAYHLPISLTLFMFAYVWMMWFYLGLNFKIIKDLCQRGNHTERDKRIKKLLKEEYAKLGDMSWAETTVMTTFVLTALLWFFREPGFMPGWSELFLDGYISDGTVAVTMSTLLFFLPSKRPTFLGKRPDNPDDIKPVPPVLDWPTAHRMFPWGILFLLGGGFALAEGAEVSGFSDWLGVQLSTLGYLDPWVLCLIVTTIICLFTECTSNVATASLFVPIMAALAQNVDIHPLYLMLPTTVATSLAFMLPVATPPNAIAFSYGHVRVIDLVKAGWMLNLLGILFMMVFVNTYAVALFDVNVFPVWASMNYTFEPPNCNYTVQLDQL